MKSQIPACNPMPLQKASNCMQLFPRLALAPRPLGDPWTPSIESPDVLVTGKGFRV